MHSTKDLTSSSFALTVEGQKAKLADVFPDLEEGDRLGVVVRQPCGGIGASALILATVTAFYDFQRAKSEDFFVYPDYFLFHVGRPLGDHQMLDIFPSHKEVVIGDDPEKLLQAVNDRAVTRLLVEDAVLSNPNFSRETLSSTNIRTALAYSSSGRVKDADVVVSSNAAAESYVSAVLNQSEEIAPGTRSDIQGEREGLLENGVPVETYRRLGIDETLGMLASQTAAEISYSS
ncbi:hypothetical protein BH20ACT11_BH20ACT11_14850 [soil metagenome]